MYVAQLRNCHVYLIPYTATIRIIGRYTAVGHVLLNRRPGSLKPKELGAGRGMADFSEIKDDNDTSRNPTGLFWRKDSTNKPRIGTTRKKDSSGLQILLKK